MPEWLTGGTAVSVGEIVLSVAVSAVAIYAATVILSRFGGARTLASMSAFDFIANVAVGAMVGSVIIQPRIGVLHGVTGVATIFVLQFLVGQLRNRSRLRIVVDNEPTLLMHNGEILHDLLDATRLVESDLQSAMRSANVHSYAEVDAIILEKTGKLSVVHHSVPGTPLELRLVGGAAGAGRLDTADP